MQGPELAICNSMEGERLAGNAKCTTLGDFIDKIGSIFAKHTTLGAFIDTQPQRIRWRPASADRHGSIAGTPFSKVASRSGAPIERDGRSR